MVTTLVIVLALSPCLVVLGLLALATWRQRLREGLLTRQAALTHAIHRELGAVAAPVVTRRLAGPWQVRMAVPLARPATVATLLAIVNRELAAPDVTTSQDYQLVLTKQPEAARLRYAPGVRQASAADVGARARSLALLEKGSSNGRQ